MLQRYQRMFIVDYVITKAGDVYSGLCYNNLRGCLQWIILK